MHLNTGGTRTIVTVTLAAALALLAAGCSTGTGTAGTGSSATSQAGAAGIDGLFQHPEDVVVDSCALDGALGWPKASITITNQSSKPSTYAITIGFQSQDGATLFGEGAALVTRLDPGQKTTQDAQGTAEIPAGTQFTCVVKSAQRTEAL